MNDVPSSRTRWIVVVAFAIAMAWFEAATVYYLRLLVDRVEPYQANPLPMAGIPGQVELVREAATLVMLAAVGMLASRTWPRRLGYSAVAFGVWDILYYVFLRIMSGWPSSVFDWDVLFLLPLPWWGPVLAPVCIALLMVAWGTLVTQGSGTAPATALTRALYVSSWTGISLALVIFMADTLRALPRGRAAVEQTLPVTFDWPLFIVALILMAAPVVHLIWHGMSQAPLTRRRSIRRLSA